MGKKWTDEEMECIRTLWSSSVPLTAHMDLFPGRTLYAVYRQAGKMGLPEKPKEEDVILARIHTFMADGLGRTAVEIASALNLDEKNIRRRMNQLVDADEMHILSYNARYSAAVFRAGAGENAAKPPPMTKKEIQLRHFALHDQTQPEIDEEAEERRLDEACRKKALAWWPTIDHSLEAVFLSMVRTSQGESYRRAA